MSDTENTKLDDDILHLILQLVENLIKNPNEKKSRWSDQKKQEKQWKKLIVSIKKILQ